ncbi:hypothetical protein ASF22_18350 [Methylobacterium sp. Leaf87]|jgi:hypothetical protein|uniref:hypothetical protein n=1 Tax=Methylobacterium sp. Leaf87 TaxID=1736243 RepID=UPI0006F8512A|nr:hypothetical protein [Methylobacterium sp. Leaf87]KQO69129.1 hypothetical protein ASF22_18350 [Methylobacterium sp. Leaf87]
MQLHHPIVVPDLVEAWILDRLSVAPTGDGDRPSLRFFRDRTVAGLVAQAMQDRRDDGAAGLTARDVRQGAVLAFDRTTLSSATQLISVREARDDLREDEVELRARTDLLRLRQRIRTIHLGDEEIDFWIEAYASGHPGDDGTGRWTKAVLGALDDLYGDPRRIPGDLAPPEREH